jgi:DNA-binding response OmpR family regulator
MTDTVNPVPDDLPVLIQEVERAMEFGLDDGNTLEFLHRLTGRLEDESGAGRHPGVRKTSERIRAATPESIEPLARRLLDELVAALVASTPEGVDVLLVEDDLVTGNVLEAFLRSPGRRIHRATTAKAALAHLHTAATDVALVDLMLPDSDGRDLLREIRRDPATSGVAVVVLTGLVGTRIRAECIALGADDFVPKPARPEDVRAAAAHQIRRVRGMPFAESHLTEERVLTRDAFLRRFEEFRAGAPGQAQPLALLTSDAYERAAGPRGSLDGDALLRRMGEALAESLPAWYVVAHWGEDRFVTFTPGGTMEDLRERLEHLASVLPEQVVRRRDGSVLRLDLTAAAVLGAADQAVPDMVALASALLERAHAEEAPRAPAPSSPRPGTATVLLVEDDEITARLVEHRLTRSGFKVVRFADGLEAHAALNRIPFDLALLDVKLPGMDGFQLLAALREDSVTRRVPVVILSAMTSESDIVRALGLGADDYILKPFSPVELVARVKRLLLAWSSPGG